MRRLRLGMMAGGIGLDPDAVAFLLAAGITDATISAAINTLVIQLKSFGVWTKLKAVYPFVGGTATTHKFNLKNPVDSNAAFRIVFNGGWAHTSNGIFTNGSNTYGNTYFNPFILQSPNTGHYSIYNRTQLSPTSGLYADIGCYEPTTWFELSIAKLSFTQFHIGDSGNNQPVTTATSDGFFIISRNNSVSTTKLFRNLSILKTASVNFNSFPSKDVVIGAVNNNNVIQQYQRGGTNYAFASIGDGLTDTEAANYYTAVQAFQTTLGRQV